MDTILQNKDTFVVSGFDGEPKLSGEVSINGAKNAALPLMAAAFLFDNEVSFSNFPEIEDVKRMSELMEALGAKIKTEGDFISIDASKAEGIALDRMISKKLRASVIITGPMLTKLKEVKFPHPGGCVIGARPIDFFIEGFIKMGAEYSSDEEWNMLSLKEGKMRGAEIFFPMPSVTGTESLMMAAVLAQGTTKIENAAMEPEVVDLANFLISGGARIDGAGTPTITINGGELLHFEGEPYKVIPDRIEAGSFVILGAVAAKELVVKNCDTNHLLSLYFSLKRTGIPIEISRNEVRVSFPGEGKIEAMNIKTHEYPGFPTDLQAPMSVLLTQAKGQSLVFETIFDGRLNYSDDLIKMGANIMVLDAHRMMINGPTKLRGRNLAGPDLRAGLAFLIAGIIARGQSVHDNIYYIDRGYQNIEGKLRGLGAEIKRIKA